MVEISANNSAEVKSARTVISLHLFAGAAEAVGLRFLQVSISDGALVNELLATLVAEFPVLATMSNSLRFAVNQEFVDMNHRLCDGDEVAVLPPVSGG